jgi:hypothetical protein
LIAEKGRRGKVGFECFIFDGLKVNEKMISKIKKPEKMNNTTFRVCEKPGGKCEFLKIFHFYRYACLSLVTN